MPAVIIPAHNEANVIERCLDHLLSDAQDDEFQVVVVCNGCDDATASRARSYAGVTVIETEIASKALALNIGDREATSFPRVYLDCDVQLSTAALRDLFAALPDEVPRAGAPQIQLDLRGASQWVRLYYGAWLRLAYARNRMVGTGVYGLSKAGRARFESFSERGVDDQMIHLLFPFADRVTSPGEFIVRPARSVPTLIRVRSRMYAHNIHEEAPVAAPHELGWQNQRPLSALRERPSLLPNLIVYSAIQIVVRWRGARLARAQNLQWTRDLTSR